MSGKFLHVFTDENPELKKQIGCDNGLFHMFDRQLLLTGGRRLDGHGHKRNSSSHAILTTANRGAEQSAGSSQQEKGFRKSLNENQMVSMESSRTSFSLSSCSTFSSPECSKSTQHEALPFERTIFLKKFSMNSQKLKTTNADGCLSLDFRDDVKDSINRDSECLSVRTSSREVVKNDVFKHVDSQRPMQLPKSMESSEQVDLDESLQALVKLKEAPWSFSDYEESPRTSFEAKAHRLSFDGKEISRKSLDSRENSKLTSQLQEPPRLSLDSKESYLETKPNLILKDSERSNNNQEVVSPKCTTSVIAKLMGLEAMPRLCLLTQGPVYNSCKDYDPFREQKLKTSTASLGNKDHSKMKPISSSRVPIEPAPWRQKVKHHVPHKAVVIDQEAHVKQHSNLVYSKIERKLKQLEFGHFNRDLRVLKQILDAMHEKGLLNTTKDEWKTTRSNETFEFPIVIMKPANSVKRSSVQPASVIPLKGLSGIQKLATCAAMDKKKATTNHQVEKGQTFSARLKEPYNKKSSNRLEENVSHQSETVQVSSRPQQSPREKVISSLKISGSLSPKLVQKRLEVESSRPPLPSSNSNNSQRPSSNRTQLESVSRRSKLRHKPATLQNSSEPLNESSKTRNFTCQCDENSQSSETKGSLLSQMDIDVLHQGSRSPSGSTACKTASIKKQKKTSTSLKGEVSSMEFVTAPHEQPSPVSVLDASVNQDDLPQSPLKKSSNFSRDEKNQTKNSSSKISQKLQSIENLIQKLNELSSTDDNLSTMDHIASLCETRNPNHRYISEILLASGLLFKDLSTGPAGPTPIQLQPSGHPINPDLFLVLEQTKPKLMTKQEKLNRKLLFDVANEVLTEKLELTGSSRHRFPSGQQVLKELCLEIDRLQAEASSGEKYVNEIMMPQGWTNFEEEFPNVVLEIERSLFKEAIDDIVSGEALFTSESKSSRRRRQLFTA